MKYAAAFEISGWTSLTCWCITFVVCSIQKMLYLERRMMVQMSPSVSRWFPSRYMWPMFSRCTRCSFRNCRALSTSPGSGFACGPSSAWAAQRSETCVHGLYCLYNMPCTAHFIMHLYLSAVRVNSDIQCMQEKSNSSRQTQRSMS